MSHELLQLMGAPSILNEVYDEKSIHADWQQVNTYLQSNPDQAFSTPYLSNSQSNTTSTIGNLPLDIALANEVTPVPTSTVTLFLRNYTNEYYCIDNLSQIQATFLKACHNPHTRPNVMRQLLDRATHSNNSHPITYKIIKSWQILHHISCYGNVSCAQSVISYFFPRILFAKDEHNRIPLVVACRFGKPEMVRLLIEEGIRAQRELGSSLPLPLQQQILMKPSIPLSSSTSLTNLVTMNGYAVGATQQNNQDLDDVLLPKNGICAGGLFEKDTLGYSALDAALIHNRKDETSWERLSICIQYADRCRRRTLLLDEGYDFPNHHKTLFDNDTTNNYGYAGDSSGNGSTNNLKQLNLDDTTIHHSNTNNNNNNHHHHHEHHDPTTAIQKRTHYCWEQYPSDGDDSHDLSFTYPIVHAAIGFVPIDTLQQIIDYYHFDMKTTDSYGFTPLTKAIYLASKLSVSSSSSAAAAAACNSCTSSTSTSVPNDNSSTHKSDTDNTTTSTNTDNNTNTNTSTPFFQEDQHGTRWKDVIEVLLLEQQKNGKESTYLPDNHGRLPLHIAISQHIHWGQGLEFILKANYSALEEVDPITKLHPFMLAAVGDGEGGGDGEDPSDLTTVYKLLQRNPAVLSYYFSIHDDRFNDEKCVDL